METYTVNYHLKKVFDDSELETDSVIRNFRITAADGKSYNTKQYNLATIIAVGYKVNSERAVQFRYIYYGRLDLLKTASKVGAMRTASLQASKSSSWAQPNCSEAIRATGRIGVQAAFSVIWIHP